MKWSITQLRKYQGKPFEFDQTVSFDNLKESLDLIDLSPITIQGQLTIKSTEVVADIHILERIQCLVHVLLYQLKSH